jgi:hypothetical protein
LRHLPARSNRPIEGRRRVAAYLPFALLLFGASSAGAQLNISGQADILAMEGADTRGLNRNFRSDSPFSQIRVRVFAQRWLTERIGVFTEAFFDSSSGPRLNGAYVVLNEVAGLDWLNVRAGMAPSIIGNFGLRSTYFNSNPLIGVPIAWQHRTTLESSGLASAADLLRRRADNIISLPILYDACWNYQWEFLGQVGKFEYSIGVTPGSMSNPLQTPSVDGVQTMARIGYVPVPEVRLGVSGGIGPYIGGPNRDTGITVRDFPGDAGDYDQRLLGWDAEITHGKLLFFSEGYVSTWEAPLVAEDLTATTAYVEGRYDFLPEWFGAVRVDGLRFSEISDPASPGTTTGWDDDVLRIESSLTYRWARELQIRGGWQHTRFLTGGESPVDLFALQIRAVF